MARESGVAIVVVMGVMGVLLLVTAWVATGTQELRASTNGDSNTKRALAAADAGLAAAVERLSRTTLLPGQCLSNLGASAVGTGECTAPTSSQTVSLGNNTSYRFLVSREVGPTTGCTSGHVPVGYERCVTAWGRANGVERRVMVPAGTRVSPMFPAGIIGLNGLLFDNSSEVRGSSTLTIGSNGPIQFNNSNNVSASFSLGPSGSLVGSPSSGSWSSSTRSEPWTLGDVGVAIDQAWASNNNSALVTAGLYSTSTRRFSMNGMERTIPGGTYVMCEFYAINSAKLHISSGQTARIYIDSPLRAGSPCPAPTTDGRGRGRLVAHNSIELNLSGTAQQLQFVLAGTGAEASNPTHTCPDGVGYKQDVVLCNSVKMKGGIYAPNSEVIAVNSVEIEGGIAARMVKFINSAKFLEPTGMSSASLSTFARRAWYECKASPSTPSDPESGCLAP